MNSLFQSPYGEPVEAEKAPEAISKAVASLPPEQMFELMKQMKVSGGVPILEYYSVTCLCSGSVANRS